MLPLVGDVRGMVINSFGKFSGNTISVSFSKSFRLNSDISSLWIRSFFIRVSIKVTAGAVLSTTEISEIALTFNLLRLDLVKRNKKL